MDRLIRFLDVAHRIWGAMALVVFGLLAIDAYGYFTHQPGSPTHAVFAKGWQYIGESAGFVQHVDDVTPSATYKGTRSSPGSRYANGSADAPAAREGSAASGRPLRDSSSLDGTTASAGGGTYSEDTDTSNADSWSCPQESRSTRQQRPVAQFPSLATLTNTRQRRSAIRELEARLRCDYQAERADGNADAAASGSFEEWRQATLQRRYGPEWNRIAQADLPTP